MELRPPKRDTDYSLAVTVPTDYVPASDIDFANSSLTQIADHFKTDKGTLKHNFTQAYEMYFAPLRSAQNITLVEVGVACGSSLKMWSRYFANPKIIGIDINPKCVDVCRDFPNIEIRIGDASKSTIRESVDIWIDDGSHVSQDIVDTFAINWARVKPGGFYVIEDLICTHDPYYHAHFGFPMQKDRFARENFMGWLNVKLKEMDRRESDILFMHFYKELCVIRKRP